MKDDDYQFIEKEVTLQIVGFVDTYGSSSGSYFYLDNQKMNSIINEFKTEEIQPYTYMALMSETQKSNLKNTYLDLTIIKRTSDEILPNGSPKGMHEE